MDAKFGLSLGGRGGREALVPTNSIMSQQSGEGDPDISRDVDLIDRFILFGEVSFLLLFALSFSLTLGGVVLTRPDAAGNAVDEG